jgi:hypothetical protein
MFSRRKEATCQEACEHFIDLYSQRPQKLERTIIGDMTHSTSYAKWFNDWFNQSSSDDQSTSSSPTKDTDKPLNEATEKELLNSLAGRFKQKMYNSYSSASQYTRQKMIEQCVVACQENEYTEQERYCILNAPSVQEANQCLNQTKK